MTQTLDTGHYSQNKIESANMVIAMITFLLFDWELHSNGVCEIGITIYIKRSGREPEKVESVYPVQ